MKTRFFIHIKREDVNEMEHLLKTTLQPVTPRSEYARKLRYRLLDHSVPTVEIYPKGRIHAAILIVVGILSGLILLLTNGRAIISILSSLGILNYFKRQSELKRHTILHNI